MEKSFTSERLFHFNRNFHQDKKGCLQQGFAAMAGRRTSHRLYAGIGGSPGMTNIIRLYFLSSTSLTLISSGSGLDVQ
jgi:hypothetical protein